MSPEIVSVALSNGDWICMEINKKRTGRDLKSRPAFTWFWFGFKSLQTARPFER